MIDLQAVRLDVVRGLCERFHGYAGAGGQAVYAFAVIEHGVPIAAFSWQPPPLGAARAVCPEAPHGVLALSRMVAVEKSDRELVHISKPLKIQMRRLIDRTRWPVLLTFSDEGQGHTGHVYKCSGWQPTTRREVPIYLDAQGRRTSRYTNGKTHSRALVAAGTTWLQRWEHWACARGDAAGFMTQFGWVRVPIAGRLWRSGAQAFRWERHPSGLPGTGIDPRHHGRRAAPPEGV